MPRGRVNALSSMLYVLGRWSVKSRKLVVGIWALILVLLGVGMATMGGALDNEVTIPGTESGDALGRLGATFPQIAGANAQLTIAGPDGTKIDEESIKETINQTVAQIAKVPDVQVVTSIDDTLMPAEINDDHTAALINIQLSGSPTDVPASTKEALKDLTGELEEELPSGFVARLGGQLFASEFPTLSLSEALGVLVALVVLVLTLGTLLAAGLPIVIALVGVGISTMLIFLGAALTPVNATTPLLSVMLGLAVGIDYSLFVISRHRDQMRHGVEETESIARATGTAGGAVVFAGVTVMIALLGLSIAGIPFLSVMGLAGAVAVGIAVILTLTLTPALLGFVGKGVLLRKERREKLEAPQPNRFFSGWFKLATKLPVLTIVVVIVGVGLLSLPALHLRLALPDAGVLPKDNQARQAYDLTSEKFGPGYNGMLIVSTPILHSDDPLNLMREVADQIKELPGVKAVPLATPNETIDTGIIQVIPKEGADSVETEQLVHEIRAMHDKLEKEYGVDISVTGMTAVGIDVSAKLSAALAPFALVVVGLSLLLLLVVFRSIAIPITATLGYLLSVAAAFGVVTAIFSDGVFAGFFQVTHQGPVLNFMPIVVMGILFGLSMDYEVFLVSRMREEYVHTGNSRKSIQKGFLGSAKVVTAAAIIMVSVFVAFVPNGDANIKPIALGLAVGVAIDAFMVRMTLIPAVMMLMGEATWWMPKWLDRILPSFDIEGEGVMRQRKLDEWPGRPALVAVSDLAVGASSVSFIVPEGNSLLISGGSNGQSHELLLTLAGRAKPDSGVVKVLGYLLPERAGAVRRKVAYVDAGGDLEEQLRRALREKPKVIAIDLGDSNFDLGSLAGLSEQVPLLVASTGASAASAASALPGSNWSHLKLGVAAAPATTPTSEVRA